MEDIYTYFCYYISPNVTKYEYNKFLIKLENSIRQHGTNARAIIIEGVFNAKPHMWGNNIKDKRGDILAECILPERLEVVNIGPQKTSTKGPKTGR